jgi:hypothetical protein
LTTWAEDQWHRQQAFVWTHEDYECGTELHIPEKVIDIEMLSGHWVALKAIPEQVYNKYALHLYDLRHPERIHIPSPIQHNAYHDFLSPNDRSLTFYAVTIDTTEYQSNLTQYHIDTQHRLSVVREQVCGISSKFRPYCVWKSFPFANGAFMVASKPFIRYKCIPKYYDLDVLRGPNQSNRHYKYNAKRKVGDPMHLSFGLTLMQCAPENDSKKDFRTLIMGQFDVFEDTYGVFTVEDCCHSNTLGTIALNNYPLNGVKQYFSEVLNWLRLKDTCRGIQPEGRQFTFMSSATGSYSHLDYVFASPNLQSKLQCL